MMHMLLLNGMMCNLQTNLMSLAFQTIIENFHVHFRIRDIYIMCKCMYHALYVFMLGAVEVDAGRSGLVKDCVFDSENIKEERWMI